MRDGRGGLLRCAARGLRPFSDFEWFAVDGAGRVAFLTSAEFGPIPRGILGSKGAYEAVRNRFAALPDRCDSVRHRPGLVMSHSTHWADMARKGLFCYDWCNASGESNPRQYVARWPYHLVASPTNPLTSMNLPIFVRDWLGHARMGLLEFGNSPDLIIEDLFDQVNV